MYIIKLDDKWWLGDQKTVARYRALAKRFKTETAAKAGLTRFRKGRINKFDNAEIVQDESHVDKDD